MYACLLMIFVFIIIHFILFQKDNKSEIYFIHIPKNAGSTIEKVFKKNGILLSKYNFNFHAISENICSQWHLPPKYLPKFNFKDYKLTFCIIRDPLERLVSEANYLNIKDINKFIKENLINDNFNFDCHLIPQSEYIYDYYGNEIDEILIFENLDFDFPKLIKKYNLNIKYEKEKFNQSKKVHNIEDIQEENINLIKSFYKKDYELIEKIYKIK